MTRRSSRGVVGMRACRSSPTRAALRLRGAALALVMFVTAAGSAFAQSPEELEKQLEHYADLPQQATDVVRQLIQELTDFEGEQEALLEKLGQADDRAAQEKARADALERELARLDQAAGRGDPSAAGSQAGAHLGNPPLTPVPEPLPFDTLTIPARQVNALGVVGTQEQMVAEVDPAIDAIRLVPLETLSNISPLRIDADDTEIRLMHEGGMGDAAVLATLRLSDGRLTWAWSGAMSGRLGDSLQTLHAVLATGVIEALDQRQVRQRWQVAPTVITAELRDGRTISMAAPDWLSGLPLTLEPEGDQPGWAVESASPQVMQLVSGQRVLAVRWQPESATLQAASHTLPGGLDRYLQRQIETWETDLLALRTADAPDARQIEQVEDELRRLRSARQAFTAAGIAAVTAPRGCVLRLTAPNGVVCARFDMGSR